MLRKRNIALHVILCIVTCFIWNLVWRILLVIDMRKANKSTPGPLLYLLLCFVTCGIYDLFYAYKAGDELDRVTKNALNPSAYYSGSRNLIYLILEIFTGGFITNIVMQNDLNKLVDLLENGTNNI